MQYGATIVLSVVLAFVFGYGLTTIPLIRSGLPFEMIAGLAFASDTASITTMEIVDNAILLLIPGAMSAGLDSPLFWGSLALSLVVAGAAEATQLCISIIESRSANGQLGVLQRLARGAKRSACLKDGFAESMPRESC